MITIQLKSTLTVKTLNVALDFNCTSTAALKPIQKMVTKNTKIILTVVGISCINKSITAADPIQLWPKMAMVE
jgi:hypothetical protein